MLLTSDRNPLHALGHSGFRLLASNARGRNLPLRAGAQDGCPGLVPWDDPHPSDVERERLTTPSVITTTVTASTALASGELVIETWKSHTEARLA